MGQDRASSSSATSRFSTKTRIGRCGGIDLFLTDRAVHAMSGKSRRHDADNSGSPMEMRSFRGDHADIEC